MSTSVKLQISEQSVSQVRVTILHSEPIPCLGYAIYLYTIITLKLNIFHIFYALYAH